MSESEVRRTPRATVRRLPDRGKYDRAVIDAILDNTGEPRPTAR